MKNYLKIFAGLFVTLAFVFILTASANENDDTNNGENENPPSHTHTPSEAVTENAKFSTCTEDGGYESVVYCSECGEELSREIGTVASVGHISSEVVREKEVSPTCYAAGNYDSVTYCTVCGLETFREQVITESIDHIPADPIAENIIDPVCKTDGSCDMVVKCSMCNTELSRTADTVPAIGHKWSGGKCGNCGIAYSVAESLELTLSDDGTYYIITGIGTFVDTELIMPSEYKGLPVKEIGNYAFENCTFVTRAVIPASVTKLGYGAALGCTGLEELILEDRKGWALMEGHDDTDGLPIPSFLLINTSLYFDLLIDSDSFWLVKTES